MEPRDAPEKRKSGGQPGNTNALKHGLYSRRFHTAELAALQSMPAVGLQDEIDLIRVVMRRVFEQACGETLDLEGWSKTLGALGRAASNIATLLRAQGQVAGKNSEVAAALSQALADVLREFES